MTKDRGFLDLSYLLSLSLTYSKDIFTMIRHAYEMAHLYTARFKTIRENFEIDTATNPEDISTERGTIWEFSFVVPN